jgi:hypothetical protein
VISGTPSVIVLSLVAVSGIALVMSRSISGPRRSLEARSLIRVALAVVSMATVAIVSGWVPAAVVTGAAVLLVTRFAPSTRARAASIADGDALATWIESVRDLLLAGEQPVGAIIGSVRVCPDALRPAVRRLAAGLGRHDLEAVLREFADDLDDPIGDLVAIGLLIALRRGARTAAVLGSLAEQVRFQSERRRLVEAERAPARREVSMLVAIMTSLLAALLFAGRSSFLDAYDTIEGQSILVVAIVVFAALIRRTASLSVFPQPARFFGGVRP